MPTLTSKMVNVQRIPGTSRSTRELVLRAATRLARIHGLEHFSIHDVTSQLGVSKSLLYRRYASRTQLVVDLGGEYSATLLRDAAEGGRTTPKGIRCLAGILNMWLHNYVLQEGGCLILSGAIECAGRPDDEVRHAMKLAVNAWRSCLRKQLQDAVDLGEFPSTMRQDVLAFEIFSFVLGIQHDCMFLGEAMSLRASRLVSILERHGAIPSALHRLRTLCAQPDH